MKIRLVKFTGLIAILCPVMASTAYAQIDSHNAIIEQSGADISEAVITQENAPQAYASIMQSGQMNNGTILQVGPAEELISATIIQTGSTQGANIEQSDVEVSATGDIVQVGSSNGAEGVQTGVSTISFSIDQNGEANITNIYQSRMNGNATVTQRGYGNNANVNQINGLFHTDATIYQEGSQNVIDVLQESETQGTLVSSQIGSDNYTWVHQRLDTVPVNVSATILVEGDSNTVLADQDGAADSQLNHSSTGDFNRFEYIQRGDGQHITLSSQGSNNNSDFIRQRGSGVQIHVDRTGTQDSEIWIDQDGLSGHVRIEQTGSALTRAEVHQQSLGHEASIKQVNVQSSLGFVDQQSGANVATIEQTDTSSSSAHVYQGMGADLIATIYQSGGTDLSTAEIQQMNSFNTALIEQVGVAGASALIVQTGTMGYAEIRQTAGSCGMNSATINQAGEGYSASIQQGGMSNLAIVTQI